MKHMKNLCVVRPESINRLSQQEVGFFAREFLLRIRSRFHHLEYGCIRAMNHVIKRRFGSSSTRAQSHEGGIKSNTREPRRKLRTSFEGVQVPQSIEEGRLHSVFGVFAIAKDPFSQVKNALPVGHHKTGKCRRIAGPGARQQLLLFL
jgi:hypothetical protein